MSRRAKVKNITYFKNRSKNIELELVQLLKKEGWQAQRTPTSASGNVALSDVAAVKPGQFRNFEVKTFDQPKTVIIKKLQLEKLWAHLEMYRYAGLNVKGYIAVRTLNPKGWRFYPVKSFPDSDLMIDMSNDLGSDWFD